jgi:hypothetical protein
MAPGVRSSDSQHGRHSQPVWVAHPCAACVETYRNNYQADCIAATNLLAHHAYDWATSRAASSLASLML